ncbi:hypothetical protein ABT369_02685 [Dactylosporangium sp. NPDC000244]|uniref:hypothetical protein n=1 Tax=Dactylosporangium sp. NPDC000244 TaxID=3154365 RepID=UPI00331DD2DD
MRLMLAVIAAVCAELIALALFLPGFMHQVSASQAIADRIDPNRSMTNTVAESELSLGGTFMILVLGGLGLATMAALLGYVTGRGRALARLRALVATAAGVVVWYLPNWYGVVPPPEPEWRGHYWTLVAALLTGIVALVVLGRPRERHGLEESWA